MLGDGRPQVHVWPEVLADQKAAVFLFTRIQCTNYFIGNRTQNVLAFEPCFCYRETLLPLTGTLPPSQGEGVQLGPFFSTVDHSGPPESFQNIQKRWCQRPATVFEAEFGNSSGNPWSFTEEQNC